MRSLLPCALACALVLALVPPSPRPVSAQEPKEQRSGPVFEHRVFRLDERDYRDKEDYMQLLRTEGRRAVEAAFYERVLQYLGAEGWELVAVERRSPETTYLYLKRLKAR